MISIPQLAAENVLNFIKANYTGAYNLLRQFDGEQEYELPAIIIGANSFSEIHPDCGVYQGTLSVGIFSQIDEIRDATIVHDSTAAEIVQMVSNRAALFAFFNSQANGHIWGLVNTSYGTDKADRYIFTIAEYEIHVQNLSL